MIIAITTSSFSEYEKLYKLCGEKEKIEYSSKTYIPDFVFRKLKLIVEIKFCGKRDRDKTIISEINASGMGIKDTEEKIAIYKRIAVAQPKTFPSIKLYTKVENRPNNRMI